MTDLGPDLSDEPTSEIRELRAALRQVAGERDQAHGALNRLSHGVVITDEHGLIRFANCAAAAILRRGQTLTRDADGSLAAVSSSDAAALQQALRTATASDPRCDVVTLRRADGVAGLLVHVTPLPAPTEARAFVWLVDPQCATAMSADSDTWRSLYNFTAAEVVVADKVSQGSGLQAVAEQLSVSLSTVRTHLRHIFTKTGTHRQAELARLLHMSRLIGVAAGEFPR